MKAIKRDAQELKDRGIEWVGAIPSDWELIANKYVMHKEKNLCEKWNHEDVLSLTMNGVIVRDLVNPTGKMPATFDGYQYSEMGDLLMCLFDIDVTPRCVGRVYNDGVTSPAYSNFKLHDNADLGYYYYLMMDHTKELLHLAKNLRHSFTEEQLGQLKVPLPSLSEQQVIATYLDDRCAKIDTIIAEAKASIEEYKELKQAVIYDAVTKGLDKNSEMNTYNDWFEQCPSKWKYEQIRYLYELRDEKNYAALEDVNLISLYTELGVVQHSDIEETTGNRAVTADGYKKVYPDDIVVNIILCWMGAMGRSDYQGVTSPAYDVYKPIDSSKVCSRYYHYLFRTDRFSKKCYTVGRGIMMMRWRTYSSQFRAIKVPVPSYEEQVEIADFLDVRIGQMDELIQEKQSLIDELESYKKSLIYEVVTGKRKVVD